MHTTWFKLRLPILTALTLAAFLVNILAAPASVTASATINSENLLQLHNVERRKTNLPVLKLNATLSVSAQRKAQAMLDTNCWSHYCPTGVEPWQFYKEAGYVYTVAGENLAEGFLDAQAVMDAWMRSPTHRENVLRGDYEEVGFGIVQGRFQGRNSNVVIAVHFGTPYKSVPNPNDQTGGLPTPDILTPNNGSYFNSSNVQISGVAQQASEVRLFSNSELLTTVDATEGIFTYNGNFSEGQYTITAQSRIGERSAISAPISFRIDLSADPINVGNIVFNNINQNDVLLLINQPGYSQVKLTIDNRVYNLTSANGITWQLLITPELFLASKTISAQVTDLAGNTTSTELDKELLDKELVVTKLVAPTLPANGGNVLSSEIRTQGNIFFLGSMLLFFVIDFLRLNDTGLTKMKGKAHLHIAIVLIAVVILLAGTFSASILNGLKLF